MFVPRDLISDRYRREQLQLHAQPHGYGTRGNKWAGIVWQIAMEYDCISILDYGCGEGTLAAALRDRVGGVRIAEYDPAIPGKDRLPSFADMLVVTDVLEHVEPERLRSVLQHIHLLTRKVVWVVVATKPTNHALSDGRNAHLTIEPGGWWKRAIKRVGFQIHRPPTVVRSVPDKEWAAVLTP